MFLVCAAITYVSILVHFAKFKVSFIWSTEANYTLLEMKIFKNYNWIKQDIVHNCNVECSLFYVVHNWKLKVQYFLRLTNISVFHFVRR